MSKQKLPANKVEQEIERLKQSPHVKLAQAERRAKQDRRRKYLADLKWYEKRGRELEMLGVTLETVRDFVYIEEDTRHGIADFTNA